MMRSLTHIRCPYCHGKNVEASAPIPCNVAHHGLCTIVPPVQSLHFSQSVARTIWWRRGVSPRCGRAHHLQRREPLRGRLVPMETVFALLHTVRNGARCPHVGMSPVRWHRYLGTAVIVAMHPSLIVLHNQEMPAGWQT